MRLERGKEVERKKRRAVGRRRAGAPGAAARRPTSKSKSRSEEEGAPGPSARRRRRTRSRSPWPTPPAAPRFSSRDRRRRAGSVPGMRTRLWPMAPPRRRRPPLGTEPPLLPLSSRSFLSLFLLLPPRGVLSPPPSRPRLQQPLRGCLAQSVESSRRRKEEGVWLGDGGGRRGWGREQEKEEGEGASAGKECGEVGRKMFQRFRVLPPMTPWYRGFGQLAVELVLRRRSRGPRWRH